MTYKRFSFRVSCEPIDHTSDLGKAFHNAEDAACFGIKGSMLAQLSPVHSQDGEQIVGFVLDGAWFPEPFASPIAKVINEQTALAHVTTKTRAAS